MHERTLIKAWHGENAYRHTVVDTHDVAVAFAELRRQDAIAPALTHTYTRLTVTQWIAGEPGFDYDAIVYGPEGIAQLDREAA
jgi:hypothetical protein